MLLHEGPADTTSYLIMGYAVIFTVMALYVWSLSARNKSLKADLDILDQFEESAD